jgi:D-tyrosyl-tRNA(Tyr) deacylase
VDGEVVGEIGKGLCALVGVTHTDSSGEAGRLARKLAGLRLFDDEDGIMNRSVVESGGSVLVVSQFTLYGDTARGRRPSWSSAAPAGEAQPLIDELVAALRQDGIAVATGQFGATMELELVNDGPVTVIVET